MSPAPQRTEAPGRSQPRPVRKAAGEEAQPRPGRWRRRLLIALAILGALVWFAPAILVRTPAVAWGLKQATADLAGEAQIGSVSLGWLSPVVIEGLTIRDREGQTMVAAERVSSERSLLGIITNLSDLGKFTLERPTLHLIHTGQTTNLEQALAAYLKPSDEPAAGKTPGIALEVRDARLTIEHPAAGKKWEATQGNLLCIVPQDAAAPIQLNADAQWTEAGKAGQLKLECQVTPGEKPSIQASGKLDAFPLWVLEPWLRRAEPQAECDGRLTIGFHCQTGATPGQAAKPAPPAGQAAPTLSSTGIAASGVVAIDGLKFNYAGLAEPLRLARIEAPCELTFDRDLLDLRTCEIRTDVGTASLTGKFKSSADLLAAASQSSYALKIDLDLARTANLLPKTVRLREQTRIISGGVQVQVTSLPQGDGSGRWQARLSTTDLVAESQGQQFAWREPASLAIDARLPPGKLPVLDRLEAKASFLELQGSGSLEQLSATARCDLARLRAELAQFVDLGRLELDGQGWARIDVRRSAAGKLEAHGEAQVERLRIAGLMDAGPALPGQPKTPRVLAEPLVKLQFGATGQVRDAALEVIETAGARLEASGDVVQVDLLAPLHLVAKAGEAPAAIRVHGDGDLARLTAWAKTCTSSIDDWRLNGRGQLNAQVTSGAGRVELTGLELTLQNAWGKIAGLFVNERQLQLTGAAAWHGTENRLELKNLQLASSLASLDARQLQLRLPADGQWQLAGDARVTADLARVAALLDDPARPAAPWLAGQATATLRFDPQAGQLGGPVDVRIDRFVFGDPRSPTWSEPSLTLVTQAVYHVATDRLSLTKSLLTGYALAAQFEGTVEKLASEQQLNLNGQLRSDMAKLSQQMRPYLGEGIAAEGQTTEPFALRGSLRDFLASPPPNLPRGATPTHGYAAFTGNLNAGWQRAMVYGLPFGPATLKTELRQGWWMVEPAELSLPKGMVRLSPAMRLEPAPWELVHPQGTVIDRAHLTPEICAGMLRYVAPVLAGATEAEGEFTVALDGARVPVFEPTKGALGGKLTVHSVRVKGTAMMLELATLLLDTPNELQLAQNSVISFQMAEGRIYHKDLTVVFPRAQNYTVQTSGSVGVDGSLALVAEAPIPPRWLAAAGRAGVNLPDQKLRIPIGGTLARPQLDKNALRAAEADFLRNAAGGVLEQQLNKGLNKLLGPR